MNRENAENRQGREGTGREEEVLIPDSRARLTPAQMVERKLVSLLRSVPLPVSQLQGGRQRGPR